MPTGAPPGAAVAFGSVGRNEETTSVAMTGAKLPAINASIGPEMGNRRLTLPLTLAKAGLATKFYLAEANHA
jgi:hypothetical protein